MLPLYRTRAEVGLHVLQHGLFRQVVADDVRDIGIQRLVVGDAGAKRVRQCDVPRAVGVEQAGDSQHAVGAKAHGIDEIIIDAAVDHIHTAQAAGCAHVDDVVVRDQIAAFDQLDAHLPREVGVLVVRGVEDAGRQQDDIRLWPAFGCERPQCAQQQLRVLLDGTHVVPAKHLREDALHDAAIRQHVAHAAGYAQVVLQNDELAVLKPDQVRADDCNVHIARHLQADHVPAKLLAAVDDLARHNAVRENAALGVNVFQEEIECGNALGQPFFHDGPFARRDHARQQIVGKDLFRAFFASVDGEGDALV